jgi:DNA-binding transcriptional LysR family regulator
MKRDDLYDLAAFAVVAEQGSFTRAAAELGMSQSALSHAMKALEERLGVRLLSRTTRSVSTTEAGETLLRSLRPALEDIASGVDAVGALRGKPSGTVSLTATKHAVTTVVMPVLPGFLASHPDIRVDMIIDDNLTDIVAERIDAGIRFGDIVEKDMIAVRIGPDGRRRRSVVFRRSSGAANAPRTLGPSLHQLPARQVGWSVRLGFRGEGAAIPGSRRRSARIQQRRPDPRGSPCGSWHRLCLQ